MTAAHPQPRVWLAEPHSPTDPSHASGIDHRQARRLDVQIPLLVRLAHQRCIFGIARNLSRDGIFVETRAEPDPNCCVDLIVPGLALHHAAPAVLPTLLVHRTARGLGLMFRTLDEATAAALERLLREARSAHLLAGARSAARGPNPGRARPIRQAGTLPHPNPPRQPGLSARPVSAELRPACHPGDPTTP